ncbi:methyltransferase domain-containing protein [Alteromonas aestuariivivens]|uniref:Methyltransferase domain-containing protein n=1 Tax=Alteromonas aestuariivivens TaxID=1938339 RepID=A0A3D8M4T2_9ALTE|nr:class I SAM-dependent methyltransferase [Alteromonas aestuariivivens]RDV24555.1 methyltransferase domain-containing protein [Alteromonas aestuariivivens]
MKAKQHWEQVYTTKNADKVSWFQESALLSVHLIQQAGLSFDAKIIDVGGGASPLVGNLLELGYSNITVLDLSEQSLVESQARLPDSPVSVQWIAADILHANLPDEIYDVWHDRAAFHFLTTPAERSAYVGRVLKAVKPGGWVVMATFAHDGPTTCSGLPVVRYHAAQLQAEFGSKFELVTQESETHITPGGNEQKFLYCMLKKC